MVDNIADFKMPDKVVTRLLKEALPENVIISNDARNAACRSASIFILQLSIAAAEMAESSGRNHLENQDLIRAVSDLGLEDYTSQLVRFGAQRKRDAKRKETSTLKTKRDKAPIEEFIEEQTGTNMDTTMDSASPPNDIAEPEPEFSEEPQ